MRHLILATLVLGLTACGGEDSGNQMSDAAAAAGKAGGSLSNVAAGAAEAAGDAAGSVADSVGIDPSAKSCLEMVAKADWAGAVPACTEAVNIAPDNKELRTALETAKGNASGAAGDAIKSAADDAGGLLGE